jgi:U3 small nucleolar RNA-associated protein 10
MSLIAKMKDADPHTRTMALLVARALLSRLSGKRQIDAAGDMLKAIHLETLEDMEDISDGDNGEIVNISHYCGYTRLIFL